MPRKYFGTDGMRGTANIHPVTPDIVLKLAMAAGQYFKRGDHRHRVLIGKDTRLSGYMLEPALTAGFISMGMDVVLVGPMPTPAVAMLTASMRADIGVMISASHNPFQDNGIKLFGPDGFKLSDEAEYAIEDLMDDPMDNLAAPTMLGKASRLDDANGRYIEYVKHSFPEDLRLDGLRIVVDCANGAAYRVAPTVLQELGAEVISVAVNPDGRNINRDCGATKPNMMREQVMAHGADLGIALDGDADRLIICDEYGRILDGDQVMALIATSYANAGKLKGDVVATVMSNLGFERYLNDLGIGLHRTPVGDRYVVDAMRKTGANLGGEQSGHLVLGDVATTGDGLLAALQVLAVVARAKKPLSKLGNVFQPVPQLLKNVRYDPTAGVEPLKTDHVMAVIAECEKTLGSSGRLVLRPSGTEPVIRVMAEADDKAMVDDIVDRICNAVEKVVSD